MRKIRNKIAYRVEVKVPFDKREYYFETIREMGIKRSPPSFRGLNDGKFSYLLPSKKKDKLLYLCLKEEFGSWCWPVIVK